MTFGDPTRWIQSSDAGHVHRSRLAFSHCQLNSHGGGVIVMGRHAPPSRRLSAGCGRTGHRLQPPPTGQCQSATNFKEKRDDKDQSRISRASCDDR